MTESAPRRRLASVREVALFLVIAVVSFLVVGLVDTPVYEWCVQHRAKEQDLTRLLRVMGFLPVWLVAAAALWQVERVARRALLFVAAPLLTGLIGEGLKLVIGRVRPHASGGLHQFRPWSEFKWSTSGLATPSGHAIVAFGAAWMLCRLFPQARWIWLGLATGCAVTRVLAGAHFVSDVYLSAVVSFGVVTLLWRWQGASPAAPRV